MPFGSGGWWPLAVSGPIFESDRQHFLENKAIQAMSAAESNDYKTSFGIVRALAGGLPQPNKAIRKLDGSLTVGEDERDARWQEHFMGVINGSVVQFAELKSVPPDALSSASTFQHSPETTRRAHARLGRNKGVGRDGICAELLQAGDSASACKYFEIENRIVTTEQWPVMWQGGRIVEVYKHKGDSSLCDMYRGILLADHASKGFVRQLKDAINPIYAANMPEDQF